MPLDAEDSVDPTVFVSRQTHVVEVRLGGIETRNGYRSRPEAESVDPGFAFGHGEKRFAVVALDADDEQIAAVVLYGAGIERAVYAETFEQMGIRLRIEIVTPEQWRVPRRKYGIAIPRPHAVGFRRPVFPDEQSVVFRLQERESVFEICHGLKRCE